jgi:hypothetical protein
MSSISNAQYRYGTGKWVAADALPFDGTTISVTLPAGASVSVQIRAQWDAGHHEISVFGGNEAQAAATTGIDTTQATISLSDTTVSGTVGFGIQQKNFTLTINVPDNNNPYGIIFNGSTINFPQYWTTNLPNGLSLAYVSSNSQAHTAEFKITGTPQTAFSGPLIITFNSGDLLSLDNATALPTLPWLLDALNPTPVTKRFSTVVNTNAKIEIVDTGSPVFNNEPKSMAMNAGYTATSTSEYNITGAPTINVTFGQNPQNKLSWNPTTKKIDIAPGIPAGTYSIALTASNSVGTAMQVFSLNIIGAAEAHTPTISGPSSMQVPLNYSAFDTDLYTITGSPVPTVSADNIGHTGRITWDNAGKKLHVATGLAAGEYTVTITAANTEGSANHTFTLTVLPDTVSFTGATSLELYAGYASTSTAAYTLSGQGAVVTQNTTCSGKINWNATTRALDIVSGLGVGTYLVTLTASNGYAPYNKTINFLLTVKPVPPGITGPNSLTLSDGYETTYTQAYEITGTPAVNVTLTGVTNGGGSKIFWETANSRIRVEQGLAPGSYTATLRAANAADTSAETTLTVTVNPNAPSISEGDARIELINGYEATATRPYEIAGSYTVSVTQNTNHGGKIVWNNTTKRLEIGQGLLSDADGPHEYVVVLTATNGVNPPAQFTFTLAVYPPPRITGDTELVLTDGYEPTSTRPYVIEGVTGQWAVEIDAENTFGKVTWNAASQCLDIDRSLPVGTYTIEVTVADEAASDTLVFTLRIEPRLPSITGNTSVTLTDGYARTTINTFTVTGSGSVAVTIPTNPYPGLISWSAGRLVIDPGIGVGTYNIVLHAQSTYGYSDLPFKIIIAENPPGISGDTAMSLNAGYGAEQTNVYQFSGTNPSVSFTSAYPQITYGEDHRIHIAPGLAKGQYQVKLTATNGAGSIAHYFTLTVRAIAPTITGETQLTLTLGYGDRYTAAYTITGSAPITVQLSGDTQGGKISWQEGSKTVKISSGLGTGIYPVTLTVSNGTAPNASLTLTIIVGEAPTIQGPASQTIQDGYSATLHSEAFTLTGNPPVDSASISLSASYGHISWNTAQQWLEFTPGLTPGQYPVTLSGSKDGMLAQKTFVLTVAANPPTISGQTQISLPLGYSVQEFSYTLTGSAPLSVTISNNYGNTLSWQSGNTLRIAAGLSSGTYPINLRVSNNSGYSDVLAVTIIVGEAPTIQGPASQTIQDGYSATLHSEAFTLTGTPPIDSASVSLSESHGHISWNAAKQWLEFTPGLTPGQYSVTLSGSKYGIIAQKTFVLTVAANPPTISGQTQISLPNGYGLQELPYTLTGSAPLNVYITNNYGGILSWQNGKLKIAPGLSAGTYPTVLRVSNGFGDTDELAVTITVSAPVVEENPAITGPSQKTVQEGYAAFQSEAFTLSGGLQSSSITLTTTRGDKITWDAANRKISVAAGLAPGTYPITVNGAVGGKTASKVYTLTVNANPVAAPKITGPTALELTRWYAKASTGAFTITGAAPNAVTLSSTHGGKITWNSATRKLDIAPGLNDGTYTVTLSVSNAGGQGTLTFRLTVKAPKNPFTDISPGDWYYEPVLFAYYNGLFSGTTTTTFGPGISTSRAMVVMVLYKLNGSPAVSGNSGFTDVPSDAYYAKALTWGVQNKIVSGTGNNQFSPNANVSRQDFAVILYNYAQRFKIATGNEILPPLVFTDKGTISEYASKAVRWCYVNGIISGYAEDGGGKSFRPFNTATRAEVATMLKSFMTKFLAP